MDFFLKESLICLFLLLKYNNKINLKTDIISKLQSELKSITVNLEHIILLLAENTFLNS